MKSTAVLTHSHDLRPIDLERHTTAWARRDQKQPAQSSGQGEGNAVIVTRDCHDSTQKDVGCSHKISPSFIRSSMSSSSASRPPAGIYICTPFPSALPSSCATLPSSVPFIHLLVSSFWLLKCQSNNNDNNAKLHLARDPCRSEMGKHPTNH